MSLLAPTTARPLASLLVFFCLWKVFLLLIAFSAAVAADYDTSTSLFFRLAVGPSETPAVSSLAQRLTRWDAIYFMSAARDGQVYEQEWAFGPGLPTLVSILDRLLPSWLSETLGVSWQPLLGIGLAHFSHVVAVIALYQLTLRISNNAKLALTTSLLHIISPSGLFLSAPYQESPFTCLAYLGNLLYARSLDETGFDDLFLVGAGALYGLSTTFRSNGLLAGLLFAVEALTRFVRLVHERRWSHAQRIAATIMGGLLVASGSVVPQFVAWKRYCADEGSRPWCSNLVPSIYTFVQKEYWNVGFMRYWTMDQLPLFILASPMLYILIKSGLLAIQQPEALLIGPPEKAQSRNAMLIRTLGSIQTLLAVLSITNYHVQIITRISSAYPVWYWWVAGQLIGKNTRTLAQQIIVFMVLYASIQGGLFASFLPPA